MNIFLNRVLNFALISLVILLSSSSLAKADAAPASDQATSDRITISSDARVEATDIIESAVAIFGNTIVNGTVQESAIAIFGDVNIGPNGTVQGDAVSIFGKIRVSEGGNIIGSTVQIDTLTSIIRLIPIAVIPATLIGLSWLFKIVFFIGLLLLALILITILPEQTMRISSTVKEKLLQSFLIGAAGSLLIIPLILILLISVIGIALIPLAILLIMVALIVGYIAVGKAFGERILSLTNSTTNRIIWQTMLGLSILWIIGWIPLVGTIIKIGVIILGFGAVISNLFNRSIKN